MQSSEPLLRLGTRGSPLALAQAEETRRRLAAVHGIDLDRIAIVPFISTADRLKDQPLSEVGGKGLFTKEIDRALLDGVIDIGVHSSKDVATTLPEGMVMPAFLEREDVRDAFLSVTAKGIDNLPERSKFGTSSIRRAAQVLRLRPDLEIVPFRGNVQTRLQKLMDGVAEGTLLALAGLNRLEQAHRATAILDTDTFMPAPAQGAIGLAVRSDDGRAHELVTALDHAPTSTAITAERAMLAVLDGSCRTPIAALTSLEGARLTLRGEILSLDGQQSHEDQSDGPAEDAVAIGQAVARRLIEAAGTAFLERWSIR
jgi:hydroxymethylbilane synthase